MLTYRDFVEELRPLADRAPTFLNSQELRDGAGFRKWRHEVTDLIGRIEESDYVVNCSVENRQFDRQGTYSYTPTRAERIDAFNRDLEDTINELSTVVGRFDKFGDPKAPQQIPAPAPLKMPEKVTAAWIWNNAPISLWLTVAGIVVVIFASGVGLGQSSLYADVVAKLSPAKTRAAAP